MNRAAQEEAQDGQWLAGFWCQCCGSLAVLSGQVSYLVCAQFPLKYNKEFDIIGSWQNDFCGPSQIWSVLVSLQVA